MLLAPPALQLLPSWHDPPPLPCMEVEPRVVPLPIDDGVMAQHGETLRERALEISRDLQRTAIRAAGQPPKDLFGRAAPTKRDKEAWKMLEQMQREEEDEEWSEEEGEEEEGEEGEEEVEGEEEDEEEEEEGELSDEEGEVGEGEALSGEEDEHVLRYGSPGWSTSGDESPKLARQAARARAAKKAAKQVRQRVTRGAPGTEVGAEAGEEAGGRSSGDEHNYGEEEWEDEAAWEDEDDDARAARMEARMAARSRWRRAHGFADDTAVGAAAAAAEWGAAATKACDMHHALEMGLSRFDSVASASGFKEPPSWPSRLDDTAPSARLVALRAQAVPTDPRAQPEQLGSSPPCPQWPASGRPKVESFQPPGARARAPSDCDCPPLGAPAATRPPRQRAARAGRAARGQSARRRRQSSRLRRA